LTRRAALAIAKRIYYSTRSKRLRALYFNTFARLVRGRRTVASVDASKFDLDLSEMIELALYLGQFELDVVRAIEQYCKRGMKVLDIGANIGAHTLRLAHLVGPTGCVHAFEPTDYAYQKLLRNIELNSYKNILSNKVALWSENVKSREVRIQSNWPTFGSPTIVPQLIEFLRLDAYCASHDVATVDLVKMDIDGREYHALMGGMDLITRCRPIFIMEAVGTHFDDETEDPYLLLESLGYSFWDVHSGELYRNSRDIAARLPRNDYAHSVSLNVVAIAGAER
jgi:FkbM family methyltransferase